MFENGDDDEENDNDEDNDDIYIMMSVCLSEKSSLPPGSLL